MSDCLEIKREVRLTIKLPERIEKSLLASYLKNSLKEDMIVISSSIFDNIVSVACFSSSDTNKVNLAIENFCQENHLQIKEKPD